MKSVVTASLLGVSLSFAEGLALWLRIVILAGTAVFVWLRVVYMLRHPKQSDLDWEKWRQTYVSKEEQMKRDRAAIEPEITDRE